MSNTTVWIIGGILVLYGMIFMTGKKFFIDRWYDSILIIVLTSLIPSFRIKELGDGFLAFYVLLLPIAGLAYFISKEKYTVTNIKSVPFESVLHKLLEDRNIGFEKHKNKVILNDYENKTISFSQTLNSVDLNLRDIVDIPDYKQIRNELKARIKAVEDKVFPYTGLFYMAFGVVFVVIAFYLKGQSTCPL